MTFVTHSLLDFVITRGHSPNGNPKGIYQSPVSLGDRQGLMPSHPASVRFRHKLIIKYLRLGEWKAVHNRS